MASLWPEEIAKRTSFYYKSSTQENGTTRYHLTVLNNTDKNNVKHKLILYHSETKEVVDVMNTDDIIGVELEIALFDDNTTIPNSSQGMMGVGVNHPHAKERAEQMAKFEQNLGKKLIGGDIDDFEIIDNEDDYESKDNDRQCSEEGNDTTTSSSAAYLNIYCYPRSVQKSGLSALLQNCYKVNNASHKYVKLDDLLSETADDECDQRQLLGHRYEKHRRFKLSPTEDFADIQTLISAIRRVANLGHFEDTQCSISSEMRQHLSSASKRKKKFFVVVNPFSGTKKAKYIYETMMIKLLRECGVDHDVLFTQYSGHAYERMKKVECGDETDISKYDAIISMGGDGLLSEIMNGLKSRDDFENIAKELKFGIIGCGTCNGLAASLLYAANVSISFIFGVFS